MERFLGKRIGNLSERGYWINLIDAENVEDIECFQTDLKEIFGLMKCRKDEQALMDFMHANENYFRHVDNETYRAIGELLQSKKILETTVDKENMEGGQDMCKALEDMCQHAEEKGIELGENRKLKEQVEKKVKKGCSVAEIADMLEEDVEVIAKIVNEL